MIVYKYLPTQYKEDFLNGNIWVNTYEGIRTLDLEKANLPEDTLIYDANEGKRTINIGNTKVCPTQSEEENIKNRKKINSALEGNVYVDDTSYINLQGAKCGNTMPNAHMFCVTTKRDDLYWAEKEKYNSCVEILLFREFMKRLTQEIAKKHPNLKWIHKHDDCKYIGRESNFEDIDENFNSYAIETYFLKPSSTEADFHKQKEYRFVAIPTTQNSIIIPQIYQIDPTGLFEDFETETK